MTPRQKEAYDLYVAGYNKADVARKLKVCYSVACILVGKAKYDVKRDMRRMQCLIAAAQMLEGTFYTMAPHEIAYLIDFLKAYNQRDQTHKLPADAN